MRKIFKYKVLGILVLLAAITSCETAKQDVEPIISPDNNPKVTFVGAGSTTVAEGDTLEYVINIDKTIDRAITFTPTIKGGTADADDYTIEPVVLQPYTKQAKLLIIANEDSNPESEVETVQFEIGVNSITDRYLVHPSTTKPTVTISITNVNDPTLLTVMFEWPDHNTDIDMVVWSDTEEYPLTAWSAQGATAGNPEFDKSIWLTDPVGTYYVSIIDYNADPFDYKFTLGLPDGTVQVIEGTFDTTDYSKYTEDKWTEWGGEISSYRLLKVENDGETFTITEL